MYYICIIVIQIFRDIEKYCIVILLYICMKIHVHAWQEYDALLLIIFILFISLRLSGIWYSSELQFGLIIYWLLKINNYTNSLKWYEI